MRNVSNKFLKFIDTYRNWQYEVKFAFTDGKSVTVGNDALVLNGCDVVTSANSSALPLGNAIGKILHLAVFNNDDRWSDYDFFGCKITPTIVYQMPGETTRIKLGDFTVIEPETYGATIDISGVDDMYKADRVFDVKRVAMPCTLSTLVREACQQSNLQFNGNSFNNENYQIKEIPKDKTCREILGWCAMISGGNALIDENGRLKIQSYSMDYLFNQANNYDGGSFDRKTPEASLDGGDFTYSDSGEISGGTFNDPLRYHIFYKGSKVTVTTDDVIITGIQTTIDEKTYSAGTDGYKLAIDNPLLEGNDESAIQDAINRINSILMYRNDNGTLKGLKYRPFEIDHVSYPIVDFGDPCFVIDRRNRNYMSFVTDITFAFKGYTTIKCSSDAPIRNSSKYNGARTQAIQVANQLFEEEKTQRELAIENMQQEIDESPGLYETREVDPQSGATTIYYHNLPVLAESDIVWKLQANVFSVSTDHGKTFNAAIDASGDAIVNTISANGVNASWIDAGELIIGGNATKKCGQLTIKNGNNKPLVWFNDTGMHLDPSQTISWANVDAPDDLVTDDDLTWNNIGGKPTIPTDVSQLSDALGQKWSTTVGNNWIKTANVVCQNLTAYAASTGWLESVQVTCQNLIAKNISATVIDGKTINVGGSSYDGKVVAYNSLGTKTGEWTKEHFELYSRAELGDGHYVNSTFRLAPLSNSGGEIKIDSNFYLYENNSYYYGESSLMLANNGSRASLVFNSSAGTKDFSIVNSSNNGGLLLSAAKNIGLSNDYAHVIVRDDEIYLGGNGTTKLVVDYGYEERNGWNGTITIGSRTFRFVAGICVGTT